MSFALIPLSLYIHFPWCVRKCPYCDFTSYARPANFNEDVYVAALVADLRAERARIDRIREEGRCLTVFAGGGVGVLSRKPILNSIYIGGGTPSLLSCAAIARLLAEIRALFTPLRGDWNNVEITIEANPGTIDAPYCVGLRAAGINRLSLGVQSLQDEHLLVLGRIYGAKEARKCIIQARRAGFININLDLMYGLPSQSAADAVRDLQAAAELEPTHISWYQLTLEENTKWGGDPPPDLPDNNLAWEIQNSGRKSLRQLGYSQYEISAFCKPSYRCTHNMNYWHFGDYLGVGAGAHGKMTLVRAGAAGYGHEVHRYSKSIAGWSDVDKNAHCNNHAARDGYNTFALKEEVVTCKDLPLEFMLNALRLYQPIPFALFEKRTGLPMASIEKYLFCAAKQGYIKLKSDCLITTARGKNFLNDLLEIFMTTS